MEQSTNRSPTSDQFRPPVSPAVLEWARESLALVPDEAAKRIGVSTATLQAWESGERSPTLNQLRKTASAYRRQLSVFLLDRPPAEPSAIVAFRSLPQTQRDDPTPDFIDALRRAAMQQSIMRSLAQTFEDNTDIGLAIDPAADPEENGITIRNWLGLSVDQQVEAPNAWNALRRWANRVEVRNVLVVHAQGVPVSEMRAFAEPSRPFPVIGLNGKDSPTARTFSLIHELTHILLHVEHGIDGVHIFEGRVRNGATSESVERLCNRVAAATLMPRNDVESFLKGRYSGESVDLDHHVRILARRYHLSRQVVVRRLFDMDAVDERIYRSRFLQYRKDDDEGVPSGIESSGGGDYYRLIARDLGHRFVREVAAAYERGAISSRDASVYLRVKVDKIDRLLSEIENAGS